MSLATKARLARYGPVFGHPTHVRSLWDDVGRGPRARGVKRALTISLAGHALLLLALFWTPHAKPRPPGEDFVMVSVIAAPAPAPAPAAAARAKVKPAKKPVTKPVKAPVKPPHKAPSPIAAKAPAAPTAPELSEAQLAAATTARSGPGSGSSAGAGGRACNMVQWLEAALRRDPEVQSAMAAAHRGRPVLVWDRRWIRSQGEDGEGLAIVREAMMVHIAFAPAACKADPVRGLVLISLNDTPGAPRLALGAGDWRWTDLLGGR